MHNNKKLLKEKIQSINPNITDELLDLLTDFFIESIGEKIYKDFQKMKEN